MTDSATRSIFLDDDLEDHALAAPWFAHGRSAYSGSMRVFEGEQAQGSWTLRICDNFGPEDDGSYLRSRLILRSTAAPDGTETRWQHSLPLPANSEQPLAITITGYHAVGNASEPLAWAGTLDTRAPQLTVTRTDDGALGGAGFALAGTVADSSDVTMRLDLFRAGQRRATQRVIQTGESWRFANNSVFTQPGRYCLWLRAEDAAGNVTTRGPLAVEARLPQQLYLPLTTHLGDGDIAVRSSGLMLPGRAPARGRGCLAYMDSCRMAVV